MRGAALVAGVSALALAALLVASPASAATLPSGQRITTVGLHEAAQVNQDQFFETSPVDAVSTPVGTPQDLWPIEAIDVNDDGIGWATQTQNTDGGFIPVLRPADANTGVLGPGVPIVPANDGVDISECRGLAMLPDGSLIAGCNFFSGDAITTSYLGVLTTDGVFTERVQFEDEATLDIRAVAVDPVTGHLWVFGPMPQDGNTPVEIEVTMGQPFWLLDDTVELDNIVESADFDRDGQLFGLYLVEGEFPRLGVVDTAAATITDIGSPTTGGEEVSLRAITVWGKAALPATGPDTVVPLVVGTALLLLAGATFVALSRRRAIA